MNHFLAIAPFLLMLTQPEPLFAASPWPAESNTLAQKVQVGQTFNVPNMSGACWNANTRTFWVCCNNPGAFWALVEDGLGGWKINTNGSQLAKWSTGGDMEAICQPDDSQPIVYLMDEDGYIRQYNVSNFGVINQPRTWDIRAFASENASGFGPEAITFVPDEWLIREGFRDASGVLRTSSNGMGGLMFVGHQVGGYVHVFDLNPNNNTFSYYGKLLTSQAETADITFDRATGKLYIWHNTGSNYLEVAELNSTVFGAERKFRTMIEYLGPRTGNLEGIAPAFNQVGDDWILMTDDDNNPAGEALTLYKHLVLNEDTDADGLPDDWELRYFGSTVVTTAAIANSTDTDGDGQTDGKELLAGTDPKNALSKLQITSLTLSGNDVTLIWKTAGGRTNVVQTAASLTGIFTDVSPALSIPGTGDVTATYTHVGGGTGPVRFYRVRTASSP
ncbi:MAG: thrombospondin type 3 repeat-containing protein [Verrucomicrobiota bacterium]